MRKIIEAETVDFQTEKEKRAEKKEKTQKAVTGLAAVSILNNSSKNRSRRKLLNDIMYYLRKIIGLAKKVESLSEGVEDDITDKDLEEFKLLKDEIRELGEIINGSKK